MLLPFHHARVCGVLAISFVLAASVSLESREAPYTFLVGSQPYLELTGGTVLSRKFDPAPLVLKELEGETFHFFGVPFTFGPHSSFFVRGHGGINVADAGNRLSIYPHLSYYDTSVAGAVISYEIEGEPGDRLVRIEWRNGTLSDVSAGEHVNFQIRLYQRTGVIEFHYGSNALPSDYIYPGFAFLSRSTPPFELSHDFLIVTDNPALPTFTWDTAVEGNLHALLRFPEEGTVYRFTPATGASSIPAARSEDRFTVGPIPAADYLTIDLGATSLLTADVDATLIDVTGRVVRHVAIDAMRTRLDLTGVPPGIYIVEIRGDGWKARRKVIVG